MLSIEGRDYSVIISDFDGTLAGSDKLVPEPVKASIRKLKDYDVTFLLASGRNFHGIISDSCAELGLTGPQITAGGGEIVNPVTGEVVSAEFIPEHDAKDLFELLTRKNIKFWMEKDFEIYTRGREEFPNLGPSIYKELDEIVFERIPKVGIMPMTDISMGEELERELLERFTGLHIVKSFSPVARSWDITAAMGNKQEAVMKVSRMLGVAPEHIIGIGDGYNDYPLLEACGYGVAMGNAHDELKKIADTVVPPYQENGVAVFLDSLFKSNNS